MKVDNGVLAGHLTGCGSVIIRITDAGGVVGSAIDGRLMVCRADLEREAEDLPSRVAHDLKWSKRNLRSPEVWYHEPNVVLFVVWRVEDMPTYNVLTVGHRRDTRECGARAIARETVA